MHALDLTKELVAFETPSRVSNADVSDYVQRTLEHLEFEVERVEYEDEFGVRKVNIIGKKGRGTGGLAFLGHTDVVPADNWFSDDFGPFTPTVVGEKLYGRGSCDMKGPVACSIAAAGQFSAGELTRPVYIVCTADEEIGYGGAQRVAARSELYREMVDQNVKGIVAEPTRLEVVHAHKGSFGLRITSQGRAAHSSTREGINANLKMIPFLAEAKRIHDLTESDPNWLDDRFDPPTLSWNIGVNDHTAAINITPPQSICTVYFRPMPGQNVDVLVDDARRSAEKHGLEFEVIFRGEPFYREPDSQFVQEMLALSGRDESRTVCYGTDAAVFDELKEMVVCGPGDIAQAHTHDEWIALEQLSLGTELFARSIRRWCL